MKILIIDDSEPKAKSISDAIGPGSGELDSNEFTIVRTLSDALRVFHLVRFDLVVLDLMLPYISDGPVDSRAGIELLRHLRMPDCVNANTSVLGLTAFNEEIASVRAKFEEFGVLITSFNEESTWRAALDRIANTVRVAGERPIDVDFVAICALEEERAGYEHLTSDRSSALVSGLNVQYVRLNEDRNVHGALVRLNHMGLVAATHETAIALRTFRSQILFMSGICAGFSAHTSLGQLVFASPAWEYQAGKWSADGFQIAPLQVPMSVPARTIIDQAINDEEFLVGLEAGVPAKSARPRTRTKPILAPFATGSAVVADSSRLKHIEQQHRKVAALDMETYGVYYAAREAPRSVTHFYAVKSVVDFADRAKDDNLHTYGSIVSASAGIKIVQRLLAQD